MKTSTSDFYDALIDSYTNTIFESGLLLDEDLQIVLNYYKPDNQTTFPEYKPCLGLKISLSTLLGSLFLVRKVDKVLLLPPIVATGIAAIFEIKNYKKRKFQQLLMQDAVNISKKINSLNCSIRKYVKTRIEIDNKSQSNLFTGYTKQIELFFKDMLLSEIKFFETVIRGIETIVDVSDELTDDFNSFKDFQPLTDSIQIDTLQTGLDFLNKIHDLHIWLTSKLFSYLSIMFFSPNKQITGKVYEKILNIHLGSLLNFLKQHYDTTWTRFHSLRISVAKLNEIKFKKPQPRITNKLHKTLLSAIDNLSLITEKSHTIMTELENSDDRPSETLQTAIIDLRYHAFAAYESIDLLCKLYGILSTKQIPCDITERVPQKQRQTQDFTLAEIHHDDLIDVPEENFELYLEKDFNAINETNTYQDDSGAYLSLMLQELKQSLGKHERFIEAKKRRGSVDTEVAIEKNKIEIPSFDLNVLKCDAPSQATNVSDCQPLELSNIDKTISIPPCPPPPPLPQDNKLFDVQDLPSQELHPRSMLDGIKTLSSQLKKNDEIFGETHDTSEESE